MRRLFIIRKDLNLKPGKLMAMVGHLCEAYWTNLLKNTAKDQHLTFEDGVILRIDIDRDIWDNYVNDKFTKTICECKNLNQLKKAEIIATELGLKQDVDWGYINDSCLTDLTPENADGTTTIGIWFKPLADDIAHQISKKYMLYGKFD